MSHRRKLNDMFERELDKWSESYTFIDAFTTWSLTLSRFKCSTLNSVVAKIEIKTHADDDIRKKHELFHHSPSAFSLVWDLSIDVKPCELVKIRPRRRTSCLTKNDRVVVNIVSHYHLLAASWSFFSTTPSFKAHPSLTKTEKSNVKNCLKQSCPCFRL